MSLSFVKEFSHLIEKDAYIDRLKGKDVYLPPQEIEQLIKMGFIKEQDDLRIVLSNSKLEQTPTAYSLEMLLEKMLQLKNIWHSH